MNKELELAEALMDLSRAAERASKLLSQRSISQPKSQAVPKPGRSTNTIDHLEYPEWPEASFSEMEFELSLNNKIALEVSKKTVISALHSNAQRIDLVTPEYPFDSQPQNIKIVGKDEFSANRYDLGILYETLEFEKSPEALLLLLKTCCRKICLRMRPWTSRNGAFLNKKAFAHLVSPSNHEVEFVVTRPLASYESLFTTVGLIIEQRRIGTSQIDTFFKERETILNTIIGRVWDDIDREQAMKILSINNVDYVLHNPSL